MQIDIFPNICLKQTSTLFDYSISPGESKKDPNVIKADYLGILPVWSCFLWCSASIVRKI